MSNGQESADVVRRFFDAFNVGDIDAAFATLSHDIVWTYYGPEEKIPFAGSFRGHAGVRQFFDRVTRSIQIREMTPRSLVGVGHQVYGRGIEQSASLATGREYRVEWAHVYEVQGGLMTRFEEFIDTATVADCLTA
ncbi:nuclear transport factor 2 family protein [Flavisphingomonas formosensis]|uniref:nuclear transport factor 2 family protein n=1 Tax=Flavisphingomonas formosensis TaxID=861534 RepID=UPI0012FCE30B|nr:nuclear transport factor 2 family protein [Sphingomonas formosensis]